VAASASDNALSALPTATRFTAALRNAPALKYTSSPNVKVPAPSSEPNAQCSSAKPTMIPTTQTTSSTSSASGPKKPSIVSSAAGESTAAVARQGRHSAW